MIYKKDPKIKYTDMCKYIDDHIYTDNFDENLVYEYLFHISNMLAHKGKFFNKQTDYENFALYMATLVYLRLTNKKQYILKEDGTPKLKKIKSVLNYIKKIIDPRRIDFQQEFYAQTIVEEEVPEFNDEYSLSAKLSNSIESDSLKNFKECLGDVILTSKAFLSKIPYISDRCEWKNIYMSCLLSFLNSITLTNRDKQRIASLSNLERQVKLTEELYLKGYKDTTILYHLDPIMKDYITVLTTRLKHALAKDISYSLHSYTSNANNLKNIIFSEINNIKVNDFEE